MKKAKSLGIAILLSFLGVLCFYLVPFIYTAIIAITDNTNNIVYLSNFIAVIKNPFFQLGLKNTMFFLALSVVLVMLLAFLGAYLCDKYFARTKIIKLILVIPYFMPSGALVLFWKELFSYQGVINTTLINLGMQPVDWINSKWAITVIVTVYLWRNIGLLILIIWNGFQKVPNEYFDAARSLGANSWQCFKHVQFMYSLPSVCIALILSVLNSFNIFKEIDLLYGAYPSKHVYMIQNYIYNQYFSLNTTKLASSSILFSIVSFTIIGYFIIKQKKLNANFSTNMKKKDSNKIILKNWWSIIMATIIIVVTLLPVVYTVVRSLVGFSLEQYNAFFNNVLLKRMYLNSLKICMPIVIGTVLVAFIVSYAFKIICSQRVNKLYTLYAFMMLLPKLLLYLPNFLIANKVGVINSYLAIILPAIFNPLAIFIMSYSLKTINNEQIESAHSCGANEIQTLLKVVLPNIKKYILLLAFIVFAEYWNTVDEAIIFLKDAKLLPLSVYLSTMAHSNNIAFYATSTLYMAPILLIFIILIFV